METCKVNNHRSLRSKEGLDLIKTLFHNELPKLSLKKEVKREIYYSYEFEDKESKVFIKFGSDRGGFSHRILINSEELSLMHMDHEAQNIYSASRENFIIAFDALKQLLDEKGLLKKYGREN